MQEILPGIYHWITFHEGIGEHVHSYYVSCVSPAIVIDPRVPEDDLGWFKRHEPPKHIYLTNRLHYRHSDRFMEHFGATVWCHHAGLHHFTEKQGVKPFRHGDKLPGGILALEVDALCPEETALYISKSGGVLAIGDAIIRDENGALGFVPDFLMGDDPEAVKHGLRKVFRKHLRRKFDHLLFAHGEPWIGGARDALRRFLEE